MNPMNLFWAFEGCAVLAVLYLVAAMLADYLNPYKIPWRDLAWPWTKRMRDVEALELFRTIIFRRYGTDDGWAANSVWLEATLALEGVRDIRLSSCATWKDLRRALRKIIDNNPGTRVSAGLERALERAERWHPYSCRLRLQVLHQEC